MTADTGGHTIPYADWSLSLQISKLTLVWHLPKPAADYSFRNSVYDHSVQYVPAIIGHASSVGHYAAKAEESNAEKYGMLC